MAKRPFEILIPLPDDAPLLSDIHLDAMTPNLLTHAQFPNPQAWEFFRGWLTKNSIQHIQDADKGVLVARDPASGELTSFVKWLEYGPDGEVAIPPAAVEDEWPAFCGRVILDEYTRIAADARKRILGQRGYFHVTFLCTDPKWAGRGAATALLRELQDMAEEAGKHIILEGVVPAVPLYKRLGFETRQELQMMLPARGATERTELYLEQTMVWTPPAAEE